MSEISSIDRNIPFSNQQPVPITSSDDKNYIPQNHKTTTETIYKVDPKRGNDYFQPIDKAIVVNQFEPIEVKVSSSFETICPICKKNINTTAKQTFNSLTCFLYVISLFIIFACIQTIRGKSISCYDTEYTCPNCEKNIAFCNSC